MFRHALTAFTAYLAFGAAMATSLPVPPTGTEVPKNDRQAVLLMAHELTDFLGAESLARQIMLLPTVLDEEIRSSRLVRWILEGPAGVEGACT
jgi:hypothetical protein